MSDFLGGFWSLYISVIVVGGFIGLFLLLLSQNKVKKQTGEKVETMGHVWDDTLEEYNNPLPRWWMWMFYGTMVFGVVYLALYPGLGEYKGAYGWSSHGQYDKEVAVAEKTYGPIFNGYLKQPIAVVAKDEKARKMGERLFLTYCAQCHGSDARGAKGFPNLRDTDWLWGGAPETIEATILHGRPAAGPDGVQPVSDAPRMPAWGKILGEEKVKDVANYVRSLSQKENIDADRATRGKEIFAQNCAACHGADAKGNQALGAPNLSDDTWLYGGSQTTVVETITNGRNGVMPAKGDQLGAAKVHLLAAYVYGLSK